MKHIFNWMKHIFNFMISGIIAAGAQYCGDNNVLNNILITFGVKAFGLFWGATMTVMLSDAFSLTDLTLLKEEKLRKVEQEQARANSQALSIIENKPETATAVFTQLVENADAVDLTVAMHKVNDALMSRIKKLTEERDTALAQIGRADKETSIEIFAVDNNYKIAKKWAGVISKKLIAKGFEHNGKKITDSGKYPAIMWDRIILNQNKYLFEAYDDVD